MRRLLSSTLLGYIGRRSYSVYLYHLPIFQAVEPLRVQGSFFNFACVTALRVAATFLVAEISYRTIESGALAIKNASTNGGRRARTMRDRQLCVQVRPERLKARTRSADDRV